jgi:hypothetical protein
MRDPGACVDIFPKGDARWLGQPGGHSSIFGDGHSKTRYLDIVQFVVQILSFIA